MVSGWKPYQANSLEFGSFIIRLGLGENYNFGTSSTVSLLDLSCHFFDLNTLMNTDTSGRWFFTSVFHFLHHKVVVTWCICLDAIIFWAYHLYWVPEVACKSCLIWKYVSFISQKKDTLSLYRKIFYSLVFLFLLFILFLLFCFVLLLR